MQTLFLSLLLAAVFSLMAPAAQAGVRKLIQSNPALIWAVPPVMTAIFAAGEAIAGAFSVELTLAVLAYTAAPVACLRLGRKGFVTDFLAILLIWLPIEFGAG